jgi:hypothetical protein
MDDRCIIIVSFAVECQLHSMGCASGKISPSCRVLIALLAGSPMGLLQYRHHRRPRSANVVLS